MNYIDLFAGAGGLSEGFTSIGFNPVAHVEMNREACETLKTRAVYYYLKDNGKLDEYKNTFSENSPKKNCTQRFLKLFLNQLYTKQ